MDSFCAGEMSEMGILYFSAAMKPVTSRADYANTAQRNQDPYKISFVPPDTPIIHKCFFQEELLSIFNISPGEYHQTDTVRNFFRDRGF